MSHRFTEAIVEDAALTWLEALRYSVLHEPAIVLGEPGTKRSDPSCQDVVLERNCGLNQCAMQTRFVLGKHG